MEKIKRSFAAKLRNLLITLLTLSMLLLAVLYIGGAQFAQGSAALRTDGLPEGAFPVGQNAPATEAVYEKGLLQAAFAGIRFAGVGGGAYGNEQAASALLEFAAEPIHLCLSAPAKLTETTEAEFSAAANNNFLYLDLPATLPYQMLYALTGEYTAAASSSAAVSADRLLLSFAEANKVTLYLSDGRKYYSSASSYAYKATEVAALANDSRLADFTLYAGGVPACVASPQAASLSLSANSEISEPQLEALLSLLGFKPAAPADNATVTIVDPHGTLRLTGTRLVFSASRDGGIPVSDMLDTAKDTLDIGIYDILVGSVSLAEQLRAAIPDICGGDLSIYLSGFSHAEDTFTIVFGLANGGIPVGGSAYPYFMKLTVQNGRFRSIEARFLTVVKSSYTGTLFPSSWHYTHAEKSASLDTLRLHYRADFLPAEDLDAAWYYTGSEKEAAQ